MSAYMRCWRQAEEGDIDALSQLPDSDLSLYGWGITTSAANSGQVEVLKWVLDRADELDDANVCGRWTRLHLAAYVDDLATLQAAAVSEEEKHKEVFANQNRSGSLLSVAAKGGALRVVEWLVLELGWAVDEHGRGGATVLETAFNASKVEVARRLIEFGARFDDWETVATAVRHSSVQALDMLVEAGVDVFERNRKHRQTLLHPAAWYGRVDMIDKLLVMGVDPHAVDRDGHLATHMAAKYGHVEAIERLVEVGLHINARDGDGWTVLHYLPRRAPGCVELIKYVVLRLGADVNARANDGRSALHLAADPISSMPTFKELGTVGNSAEVVARALLELGADREQRDKQGRTALDVAVEHGAEPVAEVLQSYYPITPAVGQLLVGVHGHADADSPLARFAAHPTLDANVLSIVKAFVSGGASPAVLQLMRETQA